MLELGVDVLKKFVEKFGLFCQTYTLELIQWLSNHGLNTHTKFCSIECSPKVTDKTIGDQTYETRSTKYNWVHYSNSATLKYT